MAVEYDSLKIKQSYDLELKIELSKIRIREFYYKMNKQVFVSYSGGKDSIVLLDLVRSEFPDVPAVYVDTGNEFPEVKRIIKQTENTIILKPKYTIKEIIEKFGYPVVSKEVSENISYIKKYIKENKLNKNIIKRYLNKIPKRWKCLIDAPFMVASKCCYYLKKQPMNAFQAQTKKYPFIGIKASDSRLRETAYKTNGCNTYTGKHPRSYPLAFWLDNDIWEYIKLKNLKYPVIYDNGYSNTGCMFCGFGLMFKCSNGKDKFENLISLYPQLTKYFLEDLNYKQVLEYIHKNTNIKFNWLFNNDVRSEYDDRQNNATYVHKNLLLF